MSPYTFRVSLQSFGPDDLLSRSLERLHRTIQQTRTSRQQLQQTHSHSQDHIARLKARLEAQQSQEWDQNHTVEQDSAWRLNEELQRSQSRSRPVEQNLVGISSV